MLRAVSAALALTLVAFADPAYAQQGRGIEPRFEARRSELPESVLRAERQTGGEVLRAESMQRDGREVYRLKVLTPDGRVRIMRDDPRERRREAWRASGRDAMNDPFDDARLREERPAHFESRPPPADLAVPETLPPAERGDRY